MNLSKSIQNLLLFGLLISLFACNAPSSGNTSLNLQSSEWAMESNFKLDFGDKAGKVKELKGKNEALMKYILDGVEKGTLPAFDYETEAKLTKEQVKDLFYPIDTIILYDDNGYEAGEKAVENQLNRPAVNKFRVKQEWLWDEETNTLQSKVNALAPIETIYNKDGETVRGDLPLFWVFFNK